MSATKFPLRPNLSPANLSFEQVCRLIDATSWAFQFNRDQIKTVAEYVDVFVARKGETIFQEGARELYMCFVLTGTVDVLKDTPSGPTRITSLGRGQVFGEMALIDGEPRSAGVVAASEVTLMVLSQEAFMTFAETHPDLGFRLTLKIAKMLSQRLRRTNEDLFSTPPTPIE